MSEPSASLSIWKPVMVFLLISLIGTVWLYEHYDDKLKDELRERSAQLSKAEDQLSAQGAVLAAVREEGDSISDDMESLKERHSDEIAQLNQRLEVARKANDNLGRQLEDHKKRHEDALAEAQQRHETEMDTLRLAHTRALKTAQVETADVAAAKAQTEDSCAELERSYDAAKETIVRQETKLARLNDAIAASAAEHREQVERLQRHINERVELARITPLDADLIRAAKQAGIIEDGDPVLGEGTEQTETSDSDTETAATESETAEAQPCKLPGVKDALDKLEAEHKAVLAEQDAALRAQAEDLTDKHRTEIADLERSHADALAGLQQALDTAKSELDATRKQLDTAQEQATPDTATEAPGVDPAEIATLREQLKAAQQAADSAETALAELKDGAADDAEKQLTTLTADLAQARTQLADLQGSCDTRIKQLTAELTEAKAVAETAQAAVDNAETETETAASALAEARADTEAARAALAKARSEAEAELEGQRQALEQARAATTKAEAEAERAAKACGQETGELQAALNAASAEADALKSEVSKAATTAADAEARIKALEADVAKHQRAAEQAKARVEGEADATVTALRDLYSRFSALGGRHTERGMLLRLADTELRFPSGAATLPTGELPSLDKIALLLADHTGLFVRIEGHTDSSGAAELNLSLSRKRAEAVQAALIERGVANDRITAEGLGSSRPIGDNATAAGRSENRRVEVYVIEPEN